MTKIISFGKHKGMSVHAVTKKHPDYIEWIKKQDLSASPDSPLAVIQKYILNGCKDVSEDESD